MVVKKDLHLYYLTAKLLRAQPKKVKKLILTRKESVKLYIILFLICN